MPLQAKLYQLFLLDKHVRGMRARLDTALRRLNLQQAKLKELRRQRDELAEEVKSGTVKAQTLEHEAGDVETKVVRLREQMNSVKNNKEYQALLIEVSTLKNNKSKIETDALEQMTKVDQVKALLAAAEAKVSEQEKLVGLTEKEAAAARSENAAEQAELTAKREAAAQEVPAEFREQFEKLADIHEGEAMAPVVEESRKHMEYSCGGCYIGIPAERVNALFSPRQAVVTCPSCGRILYLENELKESLVPNKDR